MAILQCEDLSFTFPGQINKTLQDITVSMEAGEFAVLCGKSGCGKTTLLRCLHPMLAPAGEIAGSRYLKGIPLADVSRRELAETVGYVGQNPENQMVTDTVWHEMAFGLENLGLPLRTIRLRVAEMAEYFGISGWFHRETATLSGGQKQILNLASAMVMRPDILLLDEPTSSLDPTSATRFLQMLRQLNEELGTTILLSEQRLEEIVPVADSVLLMEEGRIFGKSAPGRCADIARNLAVFPSMPVAMRTALALGEEGSGEVPVSIREGKAYLRDKISPQGRGKQPGEACLQESICSQKNGADAQGNGKGEEVKQKDKEMQKIKVHKKKSGNRGERILQLKNITAGYERGVPVVEELDFTLHRGELLAVVGGNGAGKSTMLKIMAGIHKPWKGKVLREGKCCYLPQNPQSLFVEISVEEELGDAFKSYGKQDLAEISTDEKRRRVEEMLAFLDLEEVRKQNPYDLSGGQMQRLALGKLLLLQPELLLLDEPTKGMDGSFKESFAGLLHRLRKETMTIVMVSHDLNFIAEYMEEIAMVFDRGILCRGSVEEFFRNNAFYTTAFCRMCRELFPDVIRISELVQRLEEGRQG